MRVSTSIWSNYVNRLFRSPATTSRRRDALRRRDQLSSLTQFEVLEDRSMLSGLDIPVLHSNPVAPTTLFLDFNGHFEPNYGGYLNVTTPAYDFDGDRLTFSDAELASIQSSWNSVAEDFAPFNIDVTTVEPAVLAEGTPIANANGVALRVAIGGTSADWYSGNAGGFGILNSFTSQIANVVYVFAQGNSGAGLGNIASHEAGHGFGLYHQSTYDANGVKTLDYNPGDYSTWAPLMGVSYSAGTVVQTWYNGPNSQGANVLQDDMAVLAGTTNGFGYRSDDHGNTTAAATALTVTSNTWSGAGIVGTNTDVDMFSFSVTTNDTYRIVVNGDMFAANLDVVLELRNSSGSLIGSANPQDTLNAEIRKGLAPGTYFLAVKSTGTYGWIGEYTVNIDTPPAGITVTPTSRTMTTGEDGRATSFSIVLQTQPTADVIIPISSTNPAEGTLSATSLVFTSGNWDIPQIVTITGVDDGIIDNDIAYSVMLGAAVTADAEYSGLDPSDIAVVNVDNDAAGFVYSVDFGSGTINRSRLSGSQPETLVDLKALFGATGSYSPRGIAVDLAGGKMYWTDSSQKAIRRANLDGSNVETLVSFPTASLKGIALDVAAGKMYWTDTSARKIQRANLDGTLIQDLVTDSYVTEIALDTAAGKMYWLPTSQAIRRANLDGTNIEVLWTGVNLAGAPGGIALDVGAGKMYWGDTGENVIRRADLDGANVEVVVNNATFTDGSGVRGIALDVPAGKIYWTDYLSKTIYRANLDGSTVASLGSGAGLQGLAIAHLAPDISVTHRTGLVTKENGSGDLFRVTLTTQPTANVTAALSSSDTTEGTLSTTSLTFTPTNWNITQTVTVSGVNDAVVDGDIAYTFVLAAAVSSDPNFQGLNPADVSVVNLDDDVLPTKFYVVNDAAQDQTYEYNVSGGSVESYNLNSGNTAPRGAASTIAGDKTWVVDANRKVYVYNTTGGLLGSWTAGTLASNADPQGISTNGTDVWIVDAKSDKVYKYAGAATRLSGSQNAASSLNLNSGNTSPKDLVTDGASLWVVNDSTTDKVFKYSLSGSLQGSWTIATSGASSPTGITINPASVSDIWIVDSGTDTVYQYTAAASRTSGSLAAAATFALTAGNTNPQGIADPPAPGMIELAGIQVAATSQARVLDVAMEKWLGDSSRSPLTSSRPLNGAQLAPLPIPTAIQHQPTVWATTRSSRGDVKLAITQPTSSRPGHWTRITDEVVADWYADDYFGWDVGDGFDSILSSSGSCAR